MSYWFRNDNRLPQTRLAIVSYIIVGMIGVLLLGFWKLQVIDSDKYGQMAEQNRVRSIPIIAPRGRMLDRDGRVLVDNRPSFSVLLLRDDPKLVEQYLPAISDGLGISVEELRDQLQNTRNLPKFQPIVIKPEASSADLDFIESHRSDIPVLEMLSVSRRRYLPNGFLAHATGYVGEASENQIENSNGKLRPGDVVGKSGLERQYNDILMGTDGMRRVIVNSVGKEVDHLTQQDPIPGKQVQLSIDMDLQQVAEQSLGARPGAVVALDPRTGEVLAMVSRPTPDRGVLDAGSKSLSSDLHGLEGYGYLCEYPEAKIYALTEEHGHVDFSACSRKPEIGERLSVIPNHCCVVTNLFDEFVGVRRDQVEVTWQIEARGTVT